MKYFLLALLFFCCCGAWAQNLVPNPSFEVYDTCPGSFSSVDFDEVRYAAGWNGFTGTPDYYNVNCGWYEINAATGTGYCGLYTLAYYSENVREFIGRQLSQALVPGTKYYASLKVNLSSSSDMATNNIGILFTNEAFYDTFTSIRNHAQVYSRYVVSDTNKWVVISGSFIADSSYKYIVIGNFFSDALTDTVNLVNPAAGSYYYVDDICVSSDSLGCDLSLSGVYNISLPVFNIYPNPARDKVYVNLSGFYEYELYSMLGSKLKSSKENGRSVIDVSEIPSGIYLLKINNNNKIFQQKQIIIH